jgi:hypothetical protein
MRRFNPRKKRKRKVDQIPSSTWRIIQILSRFEMPAAELRGWMDYA